MSSRPIPPDLLPWALAALPSNTGDNSALTMVAGDASNRRYFRLESGGSAYIVAEAPPVTEKNEAFVAVRDILAGAEVRVPKIFAVDFERGYLLLEDMGDSTLLPELTRSTVNGYYQQAFAVLEKMAAVEIASMNMGAYDHALLSEELSRFPTWFVESMLAYTLNSVERAMIHRLDECLIASALEQPQVLVHRDFHSRNLMLPPGGELAVIDFQDAVLGPITYDLASLLRDCYVQWPAKQVQQWALVYLDNLQRQGKLTSVDKTQFLRWFDWMGLQRHIKVLGTFARLYLRDGKSAYLDDLPLVVTYVETILKKYAGEQTEFAEFLQWFECCLSPLIKQQPWSTR